MIGRTLVFSTLLVENSSSTDDAAEIHKRHICFQDVTGT